VLTRRLLNINVSQKSYPPLNIHCNIPRKIGDY